MNIGKQKFIPVILCKIAIILLGGDRVPMSQMVMAHYRDPLTRKIIGKTAISFYVFRHAMADLKDSFDRFLRDPPHAMDLNAALT